MAAGKWCAILLVITTTPRCQHGSEAIPINRRGRDVAAPGARARRPTIRYRAPARRLEIDDQVLHALIEISDPGEALVECLTHSRGGRNEWARSAVAASEDGVNVSMLLWPRTAPCREISEHTPNGKCGTRSMQ